MPNKEKATKDKDKLRRKQDRRNNNKKRDTVNMI